METVFYEPNQFSEQLTFSMLLWVMDSYTECWPRQQLCRLTNGRLGGAGAALQHCSTKLTDLLSSIREAAS